MRLRPVLLAVALLGMLAAPLAPLAQVATAAAAPGDASYTISGTVTDARGHRDPDATVALYYRGRQVPGAPAFADDRGRYVLDGVAPGSGYRVCAMDENRTACWAGATTIDDGTNLTVRSTSLTGIDLRFAPGGTITGVVTVDGQPLANAYLDLYYVSDYLRGSGDYDYLVGYGNIPTDRHGRYVVHDVTPGRYALSVFSDSTLSTFSGGARRLKDAEAVVVSSGQTAREDIAARPASIISGTLRAADGTPGPGYVALYPASADDQTTNPVAASFAQDDGTYRFSSVPKGRYVVRFTPDDPLLRIGYYGGALTRDEATVVTVTAGTQLTGVDSALPAAAEINGTLTDAVSGDPVGFPLVELLAPDGAGGWTVVARYQGYLGYGGGPEGGYDFPHLAAGTYRVCATEFGYHDRCLPDGTTVDQGADYTVETGQALTADATMDRATAIVGTLSGYGAGGATITAFRRTGAGGWQALPGVYGVDRRGEYRITGISPGTYRLEFSGPLFATEYYDDQPTFDAATDIVVTQDHWSTADAVLEPAS